MNTLEIKFRGKRIDNGEWVYGDLIHTPENTTRIVWFELKGELPLDVDYNSFNKVVIPETVGQYIGKIKTEQEIYINDLVKHGETIRIVEYRNGNTCLIRQNKQDSILLSFSENPKKVGNIFDNPELLNGVS